MNNKFIIEQALFQKPKIIKEKQNKAIFRIILQTWDEINQNKRIYPKVVLEHAFQKIDKRIKTRAFFGELDHPSVTGNDNFDMMRQSTVLLKEACCVIRDYEFSGNTIIGEMETLRNRHGKDLLSFLQDNLRIGTSMRGMAGIERHQTHNVVSDNLIIFAYDIVSNPSHIPAIVNYNTIQFQEAINYAKENSKKIAKKIIREEYMNTFQQSKNLVCTKEGVCYLQHEAEEMIDEDIDNILTEIYKKF